MKFSIEENPELVYTAGGAIMAFVMAVLRANKFTRKRFTLRLAEGLMCSMLTTALTITMHEYLGLPFVWSIPIGTLIGFVGTDLIHALIVGFIEFFFHQYTGQDAEDSLNLYCSGRKTRRNRKSQLAPPASTDKEE